MSFTGLTDQQKAVVLALYLKTHSPLDQKNNWNILLQSHFFDPKVNLEQSGLKTQYQKMRQSMKWQDYAEAAAAACYQPSTGVLPTRIYRMQDGKTINLTPTSIAQNLLQEDREWYSKLRAMPSLGNLDTFTWLPPEGCPAWPSLSLPKPIMTAAERAFRERLWMETS